MRMKHEQFYTEETCIDRLSDFIIKDGKLVSYTGVAEHIIFPEGFTITEIDKEVFNSRDFKNIDLPLELKIIGESAFASCEYVKSIEIPEGVKKIERSAFFLCVNLEKITLPNSITEIGSEAFSYCTSLKELIIPQNLKYIPDLFCANSSIETVKIPDIVHAGKDAFACCENLKTIHCYAGSYFDFFFQFNYGDRINLVYDGKTKFPFKLDNIRYHQFL